MIGSQFYEVNEWKIKQRLHKYSTCYNFSLVDKCILIELMDVFSMAPGCSNRVKQNGISFYRLPMKDSTRLQKRLNNMKLKNPPNVKYCKLSIKQFIEDCYERDLKSELLGIKEQVKLKNDAVPILFDFFSYNMLTGKKLNKNKLKNVRKIK